MMRSPAIVMRGAVVLAAALLLGANPKRLEVTADNVDTLYRGFDRLTAEPMEPSAYITELCVSVFRQRTAEQEAELMGPHARSLVHLYSHGVDDTVLSDSPRQFPVGAIVVKEKLSADLVPKGIGGMQKMEPGYDPEGGDWLYFYSSPSSGFVSGRLENCRSCHLRAAYTDFVFFVGARQPASRASQRAAPPPGQPRG